jgi:glycosyltransferase involved in cell wall biosynthesis
MLESQTMRLLMLSSTFPYPPSRGGTEIRTFNLLKYLSQRHAVTLVTQRHHAVTDQDVEQLRTWVDELKLFHLPASVSEQRPAANSLQRMSGQLQRFTHSLIRTTPPNVLYRYSPEMQTWISSAIHSGDYDAVTCEHSVNEIYIQPEFRQRLKTVVDIHSSVYAWTRNHLEMNASTHPWRDRLYLPLLKQYEQRYCRKFSAIVVTTEEDRQEIQRLVPDAKIRVVPNGVDLELFPYRNSDPSSSDLIFVGAMDASHNIDAARFFALEVMPQLRQRYPQATFRIVGARPVAAVLELADQPGVIVTGEVASMVDELHKATVCVVPLRTGFGIKNKTLEAMAAGVPVAASDRGLEGLAVDGTAPLRALRANRVSDYIEAVSRLFEDSALRENLSQAGRIFVQQSYTWEQAGAAYEQVLSRC